MRVYVDKDEWLWFCNNHSEGRTRVIIVWTYPERDDCIGLEINEEAERK